MRGYLAWDDAHLEDSLDMEFRYTQVYRENRDRSPAMRELKCLEVALPAAVAPARAGDLLAGRRMFRPLGVAPSYWDDDTDGLDNVSFYADIGRLERVMNRPSQTPESQAEIAALIDFWKKENVNAKVRARFDGEMRREMPSDMWSRDSGVIFGLCRLVLRQAGAPRPAGPEGGGFRPDGGSVPDRGTEGLSAGARVADRPADGNPRPV